MQKYKSYKDSCLTTDLAKSKIITSLKFSITKVNFPEAYDYFSLETKVKNLGQERGNKSSLSRYSVFLYL